MTYECLKLVLKRHAAKYPISDIFLLFLELQYVNVLFISSSTIHFFHYIAEEFFCFRSDHVLSFAVSFLIALQR